MIPSIRMRVISSWIFLRLLMLSWLAVLLLVLHMWLTLPICMVGLGYEWNEKGQRCRRDSANRLYPVDKYGGRIFRRQQSSSRPDHIPSDVWWKDFKPSDRLEWHKTLKERGKGEAPKMAAIVAMTAAKAAFTANVANDHKVEKAVPASSSLSSLAVRAQTPVCLNRRQGIAGLLGDCTKVLFSKAVTVRPVLMSPPLPPSTIWMENPIHGSQ